MWFLAGFKSPSSLVKDEEEEEVRTVGGVGNISNIDWLIDWWLQNRLWP